MPTRRRYVVFLAAFVLIMPAAAQEAAPRSPWTGLTVAYEPQASRVLTARVGTVLPARDVSLQGFGLHYDIPASEFSLALRMARSPRKADLAYGSVGASTMLGSFRAEVDYAWRTGYDLTTGEIHGRTHYFGRLGAAWSAPVSATPLSVQVRAGIYVPVGAPGDAEAAPSGWEGETSLAADLGQLPLGVRLGFRFERFRVFQTEQEVSSVRLGLEWHGGPKR